MDFPTERRKLPDHLSPTHRPARAPQRCARNSSRKVVKQQHRHCYHATLNLNRNATRTRKKCGRLKTVFRLFLPKRPPLLPVFFASNVTNITLAMSAEQNTSRLRVPPRYLRFRDAPHYIGMNKNRFNAEVRPHLVTMRIGTRGIAFDRIDLDAWADEYKSRNGRPAAHRRKPWDNEERRASSNVARSGMSTNGSKDSDAFAKAVARAISSKPPTSLTGGWSNFARKSCMADAEIGRSEKQRQNI